MRREIVEVQVLGSKLYVNSSSAELTRTLLETLREFGIEVEVLAEDIRCG